MKHLNIKLPHDCLTGSLIQLCLLTEKSIALDLTTKAAIDNWGKLRGEAVKAQMHTPEWYDVFIFVLCSPNEKNENSN